MKILIIQTAFIGDVVLATPLVEKLHRFYPDAQIDFLLRKGNEALLTGHPHITNLWVWNKKQGKYKNLLKLLQTVRTQQYDLLINTQRFFSTGIFSVLSRAKSVIGFRKNPLSLFFSKRLPHKIGQGIHEVHRNLTLTEHLTDNSFDYPKLYPSASDFEVVKPYQTQDYITISPASVWHTKQLPMHKWKELMAALDKKYITYLLGAQSDSALCAALADQRSVNLAGKLTLLQAAALMQNAAMNYMNDSAPMHLASAVNAASCAVFCSTVPAFGFTPLSANSHIVESTERLPCRPCGLHGRKRCPHGHFRCAETINVQDFLKYIDI